MAKKNNSKRASKKVVAKKTTPRIAKPVARTAQKPVPISKTMAIISLLLNIVIFPLPGIGSLIGGKTKAGIWQIVLALIAITFSTTDKGLLIGIPVLVVVWLWGLMTGVQLIQSSQ